MTRDDGDVGDPGDSNQCYQCRSVVKFGFHGKKDFLAALYRAGRADGSSSPAVVEPGAYLATARLLLVGCLSQRMV